ncbi:Gfo/Idh/MocA family oxidoreductase [Pelagicoccus sp. SDUM812005]|uniref:Gfo/Idh/MocA family protein n=1 Tax=Pelagicoccus sp. SDUM812005 TaxID=3041257 RepID=UPI00280CD751|nr:Gfo/Idh/MocA family oxidoreductase [Pelagicoccus sp. SDUM812005]MDQ8180816.1 Gfo/Idh/MocA family oxidoreductase [Pelagicoccus sp. SDUM812005]
MSENSSNVAVIGAGNWGKNLVNNFEQLRALVCIAESHPDLQAKFKEQLPKIPIYDDYHQVPLDQIDAVAIATPAPTHHEVASYFLENGKDVFVEKPMTLASKEAIALQALAERNNRILMVGHLLLYQPAIQFIKKFISEGKLGKLYHLHQERKKLGRARYVENVTWSLGVHDIAVLLYLVGEQPKHIFASGHCGLQKTVEDDVYVHMQFVDGVKAHLHNSWIWPENRRQLTIVGEKGMLLFDEINSRVTYHNKTIDADLNNCDQGSKVVFEGTEPPLKLELQHFLDCVASRTTPISDGQNGIDVVTTLERLMML